jgi:hypothetical protein
MDVNVSCFACTGNWSSSSCESACSGEGFWHSNFSVQLTADTDVMGIAGPTLLWAAGGIIIGMPIFWLYLIVTNREIAWSIPAFGISCDDKWVSLSSQLRSPGIFLFYEYLRNRWYWGMVLQITKIISVVLTEMCTRISGGMAYVLFISYGVILGVNVYCRPYRFEINNLLDTLIAASNMLLTIVPILSFHHRSMPSWVIIPFTIIVCVGPLLALPYSLFRQGRMAGHDTTKAIDENNADVEPIVENMAISIDLIQFQPLWQTELEENDIIMTKEERASAIMQDEKVDIHIKEVKDTYVQMYAMIDDVCDAETTLQLTTVLKGAVLISSAAAGFFFGGVAGQRRIAEDFMC